MSVTPGPVRDAVLDAERALGGGARVEHRVHVADQQDARPARPSRRTWPTTVSPSRPSGRAGPRRVAPSPSRKPRGPAPDLVDAGRRVAPAVDVDEALEVGEVGRQVGCDRGAQRRRARRSRRRRAVAVSSIAPSLRRRAACYPARTVRLVETRLLEGPNVYRLEPVVKLEVAIGRRRTWYGQRDPGRHALVRLGASRPGAATGRTASPPSSPGSAGCGPDHGEGRGGLRGPPLVRPGPLDRHVPVARRGARPASSPRPRSRWPSGTSRRRGTRQLTGAQAAAPRALDGADRRGAARPRRVDPRRRPADPDRVDLRHQRQEHGHPADHAHPAAGRPARRHDHLGRRSSSTSGWSSAGDWTGPGGAQQILGRSDIDVAVLETARGGIVLRGVGYESNEASVLTNVCSDHLDLQGIHTLPELAEVKATICRMTKPDGWVVLNARRPAASPRSPGGSAAQVALLLAGAAASRRGRRATGRAAGAPTSCGDGVLVEAEGERETEIVADRPTSRSRSAGWRATTSRMRWPRPAGRAASARRSSRSRDGLRDFRPTRRRSPGRLNLFRLGGADRHRRLRPQRGRASRPCWTSPRGSPAAPPAGPRRSRRSSGRPATGPTTRSAGIGRIAAQRAQRVAIKQTLALPPRPDARVGRRRAAGRRRSPAAATPRTSRSTSPRPRRCGPS